MAAETGAVAVEEIGAVVEVEVVVADLVGALEVEEDAVAEEEASSPGLGSMRWWRRRTQPAERR